MLLLFFSVTASAKQIRGLLVIGHEVRSLQPCGEQLWYWMKLDGDLRQQLQAVVSDLTSRPYEAVYAELSGEFGPRLADGFAADYAGSVEVDGIHLVTKHSAESCQPDRLKLVTDVPAKKEAQTYVFVCQDNLAFTARTGPDEAWVFLPGDTRKLLPVVTETGSQYRDDEVELLINGQKAKLARTDGQSTWCQNDPRQAVWERAKLDGADFRAVGNEPGWHLEIIAGSRIVLVTDYGASRVVLPLPEPEVDRVKRITRWDAGELVLEVKGEACHDTMSGVEFETQVKVHWQGKTLHGCGRALH